MSNDRYPWSVLFPEKPEENIACEDVYAGPEQMPPSSPDVSAMQCVYAGPDYFENRSAIVLDSDELLSQPRVLNGEDGEDQDAEEAQTDDGLCSVCGAVFPEGARFCSECGSPANR